MRVLGFDRSSLAWALVLLCLLPFGAEGQLRTVVSSEIAVSEREAAIRLDFQADGDLNITFQDGRVLVDGEAIGEYVRRDGLDSAWRALLGQVITLDDGPLAEALNDWAPPESLTGQGAEVAHQLDQALEEALAAPQSTQDLSPEGELSISIPGEGSLLGALLSRSGVLTDLAEAMEGVSLDLSSIHIGEDLTVEAGEEVEGTLILVDGDLDVAGTVLGDVVLAGGTVRLLDEGRIAGDLRIADGSLERLGGEIDGTLVTLESEDEAHLESSRMEEYRQQMEDEIRRDLRATMREERRRSSNPILGLFSNLGSAIAGLLENLVTFLILAVLGVAAVHFQKDRLEIVATTARRAPVRSAVVGVAGGFLLLPLWVLGIAALALSIIGIPFLLVWVPVFPIAAGIAGLLGYLAVARNVGEWVAEQEYRGLEWIRGSNTFYTVVAGIAALMVPCVASSAARILGLGVFTGILAFLGSMVTLLAVAVGFGAVLLTRGGKIRPYEFYYEFDEGYWSETESGSPTEAEWERAPAEEAAEPQTEVPEEEEATADQEPKDEPPPGAETEDGGGEAPSEEEEDDNA